MSGMSAARRSLRDAASLGYCLTQAHGFDVLTSDGRKLGTLERLRYERHAEYPEELIVRRGRLVWKRHQRIRFEHVERVDTRAKTIQLRNDKHTLGDSGACSSQLDQQWVRAARKQNSAAYATPRGVSCAAACTVMLRSS